MYTPKSVLIYNKYIFVNIFGIFFFNFVKLTNGFFNQYKYFQMLQNTSQLLGAISRSPTNHVTS